MRFIYLLIVGIAVFSNGNAHMDFKKGTFLQDDEIEDVLMSFCSKLFKAAGINGKPKVYVIINPEINAAATLNNTLLFNSGFILACKNVDEFTGVLAHETAHIRKADPVLQAFFLKQNTVPGFFVMALGGLGAILSGSPEVLLAGLGGGLSVMERGYFTYSRMQEESADAGAITYLNILGWPVSGLLSFFEQLSQKQRVILADPYLSTHPFPEQRIAKLKAYIIKNPQTYKAIPQDLILHFKRIQAKLRGLVEDPKKIVKLKNDDGIEDLYTKTVAYFRLRQDKNFYKYMDKLLSMDKDNSYFLELKGQYFLEKGQFQDAINLFKKAKEHRKYSYGLDLLLAHALTQSDKFVKEVIPLMTTYLHYHDDSYLGWRFLGIAYGKMNKIPEASLCLAEQAYLVNDFKRALTLAQRASASKDAFILEKMKDLLVDIQGNMKSS